LGNFDLKEKLKTNEINCKLQECDKKDNNLVPHLRKGFTMLKKGATSITLPLNTGTKSTLNTEEQKTKELDMKGLMSKSLIGLVEKEK
jgi:hypothetical protein